MTKIIAEIGINHNGSMEQAKKLINASKVAGCDFVKFQKRTPEICVPEEQKGKLRDTPWGEMAYIDYKHKVEFGEKEYNIIDRYCRDKSLDWTASVWDIGSLNFMENYDVPFIKIPSAHITNTSLLEELSKINVPIILSTGMSNWKMIDKAVNILDKGKVEYALLHSISTYPAPRNEINLRVIPEMQKRYDCIIGYSGHEYDLEPTALAVALGAKIIERHITLDHEMWGTDQQSSLEVHAMDSLGKRIRGIKDIMGNSNKIITESEKEALKKLRG